LITGGWLVAAAAWVLWRPGPTNYAERCRNATVHGRWLELASQSKAWSEAKPQEAQAWLYRAQAAEQQQDFAAANMYLSNVPPDSQFGIRALEARIELQFGPLNQPLGAVESCQALLHSDPNSKLAHQRLIFFFAFTLQRQKLISQIRDAIARRCEPREAYTYLFLADSLLLSNAGSQNARWLQSDPASELFSVAQAVQIAETLQGQIPRDDPDIFAKVKESIERRDRTLEELLMRYPNNLELLAYFLRQAVERGDVNRVTDLLASAPHSAEFDHRFWRYRGWLMQSHEDLAEAKAAYQQALKQHPMDSGTRHLLAGLVRRQGDLVEAGRLEQLVVRANHLRRLLQQEDTVRSVSPQTLKDLAGYAADCGDRLVADSLHAQLQRFDRTKGPMR